MCMNWDIYMKKIWFYEENMFFMSQIAQLNLKIFTNCTIFYVCPKLFNNCTTFAKFMSHFSVRVFVHFLHLLSTSQPGPGAARDYTHLGFEVWGTPGSRGRVCGVMLVLRTFPELVGRSAQNLVEIGPAVRAWKRDIGTNSHFYIYRRRKKKKMEEKSLFPWESINLTSLLVFYLIHWSKEFYLPLDKCNRWTNRRIEKQSA